MSAMWTLLRRELGAYFNTPIGYVFIVFFLVLSKSLFVFTSLFTDGVAELRDFFYWMPFIFLLFVPAISMRLWAEERKQGTLELLLTFPLRTWQAVLGKFLAGLVFLGVAVLLTLDLPLALYLLRGAGPGPDVGPILGGYLGTLVLGMVYLAVGSFASSLTRDQIVASVVGFFLNGVLVLIGVPAFVAIIRDHSPGLAYTVQSFGILGHFESISRGVVDSRDVLYALTMTGFFLFLNVLVIERRR